jgi:hypothetical protein
MAGGADHAGVLVVRVWREDNSLSPVRVRVTSTREGDNTGTETAVVASVEEAVEVVRTFLDRYLANSS